MILTEKNFRKEDKYPEYISWLNDEKSRIGNDYMLVVTDLFDNNSYPVYCSSSLLEQNIEEYDDRERLSRVDFVIQLQSQQEIERYTTKAYLRAFAEKKRQERETVTKVVDGFKEKFGSMSYEEREDYLKKYGFDFCSNNENPEDDGEDFQK